jgi:hypothetical protein
MSHNWLRPLFPHWIRRHVGTHSSKDQLDDASALLLSLWLWRFANGVTCRTMAPYPGTNGSCHIRNMMVFQAPCVTKIGNSTSTSIYAIFTWCDLRKARTHGTVAVGNHGTLYATVWHRERGQTWDLTGGTRRSSNNRGGHNANRRINQDGKISLRNQTRLAKTSPKHADDLPIANEQCHVCLMEGIHPVFVTITITSGWNHTQVLSLSLSLARCAHVDTITNPNELY